MLYGVRPLDPLVLGGVSLLLTAVALFASYLPAPRAPMIPVFNLASPRSGEFYNGRASPAPTDSGCARASRSFVALPSSLTGITG